MGIGVVYIRDDTRQELGRVLLMQLSGYDGESELRRQVAWDIEVAAEPGPEVCKGADNGGLQLKIKEPLEGRAVQRTTNERHLLEV